MRPIHDGSILGRPTQFVAFIGVLMLPVLSITGIALWWLKRRAELARKRCTATGLIQSAPARATPASVPPGLPADTLSVFHP
jgi:uncharacterized iron-regulated membrane protein